MRTYLQDSGVRSHLEDIIQVGGSYPVAVLNEARHFCCVEGCDKYGVQLNDQVAG